MHPSAATAADPGAPPNPRHEWAKGPHGGTRPSRASRRLPAGWPGGAAWGAVGSSHCRACTSAEGKSLLLPLSRPVSRCPLTILEQWPGADSWASGDRECSRACNANPGQVVPASQEVPGNEDIAFFSEFSRTQRARWHFAFTHARPIPTAIHRTSYCAALSLVTYRSRPSQRGPHKYPGPLLSEPRAGSAAAEWNAWIPHFPVARPAPRGHSPR